MVGPYRLGDVLGRGGMGVVHRASHGTLGREVALKLLLDAGLQNQLHRGRFLHETRAMAAVAHPNLIKLFDAGEVDGQLYIAMELVNGPTLWELLRDHGPIPWPVAVSLARALADALGALHSCGILHRDIKGSNVMIGTDGLPKLLDLGVAHIDGATALTSHGNVVGTVSMMAPELLRGEPASPASDLWSVGALFHHMLTGRPPYTITEPGPLVMAILSTAPPTLEEAGWSGPREVTRIVGLLLCRDARLRCHETGPLVALLDDVLVREGQSSWDTILGGWRGAAPPPPQPRRTGRRTAPASPFPMSGQPQPERRARLAWVGLACAIGLPLVWWATTLRVDVPVPTPERHPAEAPTSSPVTPVPGPIPLPADLPPRLSEWARAWSHREALRDPARGRATADALSRTSPLDLGADPEMWWYWATLGRWLDGQLPVKAPPRSRVAVRGPMKDEEAEFNRQIARETSLHSARGLQASLVRAVALRPDDPLAWCVMGWILEREGKRAPALRAYSVGLSLPAGSSWSYSTELHWAGLARALIWAGPGRLEREFAGRVRAESVGREWWGLTLALGTTEPGRLESMLESFGAHPVHGLLALNQLGHYRDRSEDPEGARAAWERARHIRPDDRLVSASLVSHWLTRGDPTQAFEVLGNLAPESQLRVLCAFVSDPCTAKSFHDDGPQGRFPMVQVDRALTCGSPLDAVALATRMGQSPGGTRMAARMALDILAVTGPRTDLEKLVLAALRAAPGDRDLWQFAAGALSAPAARSVMETLSRSLPAVPPAARALWLARCGRTGEALDLVVTVKAPADTRDAETNVEVLMAALDGGPAQVRRATECTVALPPGPGARIWASRDARRADRLALLLGEVDRRPTSPTLVWLAALAASSQPPAQAALTRARLARGARASLLGHWLIARIQQLR